MAGFELDWAEVFDRGVSSSRIVEALDVLEHRRRELGSRCPLPAIEELDLEGAEEALGHRVVVRVADRALEPRIPAARNRRPKAQEVYWDPWSVCMIVDPSRPSRRQIAICKASTTSSARMRSEIDQPMTRREKASITVAR